MLLKSINVGANYIMRYILYTGHSALIVSLLVVFGTTAGLGVTELIEVTRVIPDTSHDYIEVLIKTVPALSILGAIVYLFIKYLERRDDNMRTLLERTIDALNENSKALEGIRMDMRRSK